MMCGRSSVARKTRYGPGHHHGGHGHRHGHFFGLDAEKMAPGAQVVAALSVLAPVALSGLFLFAFVPDLWWIFTTYFWVAFPAFPLLARGVAGMSETGPARITPEAKERQLLEALLTHGELTPARAAAETSLTVAEANGMLKELAEGGHLEVRVRGGGLFYALWEKTPRDGGDRGSEGRQASPVTKLVGGRVDREGGPK